MQKQLLTSGNIFKRTDRRWNGVVWYMDEQGGAETQILLRHVQTGG